MEDRNYGTIRIKLDEMIEKQNISKNKLAHRAEMQRTQLNQFCKGTVTRAGYRCFSQVVLCIEL